MSDDGERTILGFPVRVSEHMPESSFGFLEMGTLDSYVQHEGIGNGKEMVRHVLTRPPKFTMSRPDGEGGREVIHVGCDSEAVAAALRTGGLPAAMKVIRETLHVLDEDDEYVQRYPEEEL